jgi:hypothetical protein
MNKILVGLTALALLVASVGPALANCCPPPPPPLKQISAGNDETTVINNVTAIANTGGNGIANSSNSKGGFGGDISSNNDNNKITTGNATAYAGAINVVNSNFTNCCDGGKQITVGNDGTFVSNDVIVYANTGENSIANSQNKKGCFGGDISSNNDNNKITTGNATAYAGAINVVNSNIRLGCCDGGKQVSAGNDGTFVGNSVGAQADTGINGIGNSTNKKGHFSGDISSGNDGNEIKTGIALSKAGAITIVNSNITRSWFNH